MVKRAILGQLRSSNQNLSYTRENLGKLLYAGGVTMKNNSQHLHGALGSICFRVNLREGKMSLDVLLRREEMGLFSFLLIYAVR